MKVAHILSWLNTGGAEKITTELANLMSENNLKVKIISILPGRGIPYDIINKERIEIVELNYKNKFNPRIAWDLYKLTLDCQIVHTHTFYAQFYASILISKNKLITTEHSTNNNRRKNILFKPLDYLMYKKYKRIICISSATKVSLNNWIKSTRSKSVVINNGINTKKYWSSKPLDKEMLGINDNSCIILTCTARLSKVKNHVTLIKSLVGLKENYHLFLIGNGEKRDEIKQLILSNGLQDRITLLGNRDDVDRILKITDIFVLVSLWEGFGLAALEAILSNTYCILSDVEGLNNLVPKNNYVRYVDPLNPEQILKQITILCEEIKTLKENKSKNINNEEVIRYIMNNYDINNTSEKYKSIYFEIMKEKKSRRMRWFI
ncbi:glycosyltransferase [Heyndrickxia coagulans]|uniref:glycosyltransferase n=1 Tax=Heyndrickxia coagulans TaxID=1398 RepID=UPI000211027A|nr:glycosyltransferase [Heyndrickxia coagulans]AEH52404.1 putative lipopolysaccharide biosynthesis protein [Heyndrickxia coagulans 2-6]